MDVVPGRGTEGQLYENPDEFASSGLQLGNYELTQCPAYVTTKQH